MRPHTDPADSWLYRLVRNCTIEVGVHLVDFVRVYYRSIHIPE